MDLAERPQRCTARRRAGGALPTEGGIVSIRDEPVDGPPAAGAGVHPGPVARAWVPIWARVQRWSLTRRCIMCGSLVGVRPPGESCQYCSDACRDLHFSCGG